MKMSEYFRRIDSAKVSKLGKINRGAIREGRFRVKKWAKLKNERKMVKKDGPEDGERVIGRMPSWTTRHARGVLILKSGQLRNVQ